VLNDCPNIKAALRMYSNDESISQGDHMPNELFRDCPTYSAKNGIAFRMASDIEAVPIRWLWQDRIARGKVSMIAGNPGLGKSQLTASLAAVVSTGGVWPVDRTKCESGKVVIFSAEDDASDTIRPRLEASGANLEKIAIIDPAPVVEFKDLSEKRRGFNLTEDVSRLDAALTKIGNVALVVIDPITAYLGDTDSHCNAEIRALLSPLSDLAAKHGAAVVCVSHFNKTGGSESAMRIMGSLAFVAAARAAYAVLEDPEDKSRRLFLSIKNNIGDDKNGLAFRIESAQVKSAHGVIQTSRVSWDSKAVQMTANEVLAAGDSSDRSATDEALDFLRTLLARGPMKAGDVQKEARQAGISEKALRRARERLGIKPEKREFNGGWWWGLPATEDAQGAQDAQDAYIQKQGILGGGGHLRAPEDPISPEPPNVDETTRTEGGHPFIATSKVILDDIVGPSREERRKARMKTTGIPSDSSDPSVIKAEDGQ
jgi:AAA domain-containing protein